MSSEMNNTVRLVVPQSLSPSVSKTQDVQSATDAQEKPESVEQRHVVSASGESDVKAPPEYVVPEEIENRVEFINDKMQSLRRTLEFSVDKEADMLVIKVKDTASDEIIRTIPPEQVIRMAQFLLQQQQSDAQNSLEGMLLTEQV